jgi:polar amino acid transport system permease protein
MDFAAIVALLAQGVAYTVVVTLSCAATGLFTGLLVAGLWRLNVRWLRWLLDGYTFVLRGVPVLVLLFLVYFGLPSMGLKVSPLMAMVLSLGLMSGAYLAEVFRGALDSVEDAEIVAAEAMGFGRLQIMVLIEFPQMLRLAVPGMVNAGLATRRALSHRQRPQIARGSFGVQPWPRRGACRGGRDRRGTSRRWA